MKTTYVAPVRERGLKFFLFLASLITSRRSRKGAWIEISPVGTILGYIGVAPVRERGLKYKKLQITLIKCLVAPVRERGLKCRPR